MKLLILITIFALTLTTGPALGGGKPEHSTYSLNEVLQQVGGLFGEGAEGLAEVVEKAFEDHGRPNAYIAGEEVAAAAGIGVRYGDGHLQTRSGHREEVHWRGPSIGLDTGAGATKVFVLIYALERPDDIFQRYPGVEGSLYFAGGVGMNYLSSGDTVLAPLRLGAGWRRGVNIGYMDFTREASVVPF